MSNTKLPGGLYLGYLKVKSSMDLIRVFVPERTPNVLPHSKIRDNQHVSGYIQIIGILSVDIKFYTVDVGQ